ncbi:MAG TPA: alpha/beta hydrolase family protein [Terriglobales bacterium]|nr:alpha/beta hydrolase family protein [Terriglobales bacterium]
MGSGFVFWCGGGSLTRPGRVEDPTPHYCRSFHFLVLAVLLFSRLAQAQSRVDCSALNSRILKEPVRYCVLLPPGYDSHSTRRYPVLYFLHGLGNNEQTLFNSGGWSVIEDLRQQHKISDFLMVAPAGKQSFYINSEDGRVRYNDFFIREFMPYIEAKYPIRRERKARGITGISMGGYGALHFAFAYPELFSSVSAESAALTTESPAELNTAMRSGTPLGRLLGAVFGNPIDLPHWRQNDPLALAKKNAAGVRKLAIYFNCGRNDDYGFEKGAEALHRRLEAESMPHEFHLYPGDHSLRYFLEHLGETIEFHSRAFNSIQ